MNNPNIFSLGPSCANDENYYADEKCWCAQFCVMGEDYNHCLVMLWGGAIYSMDLPDMSHGGVWSYGDIKCGKSIVGKFPYDTAQLDPADIHEVAFQMWKVVEENLNK